jgi:hypothetical protein
MSDKEDALTKIYDLMLWLFPQIGKFPKTYRFILGDRIENLMLDICEKLIEARFTKDKARILSSANIRLEKLRYLARLSKDLKLINVKKYEYMSREINQIGVYVGGWLKKVKGWKATDETSGQSV